MDTEQTPAATGDATGQDTPANGGTAGAQQPEKTFTQADVDRLIADRLARQKAALEAQQSKAAKDAEAAQLAEQGKWKELAEANAAKLAELSPAAEKAARLEAALAKQLTEAMKGVPDHLLPLLEKLDTAERLEYLAEHRARLVAQPTPPDTNAGGRGGAQPDPKVREAELLRRFPALNRR